MTDLKSNLTELKITRDDKESIRSVPRSQIPVFSVFFGETDITYLDVGDYEGVNYSVSLGNHVHKECMQHAAPNVPEKKFHIAGQMTDLEFDSHEPTRVKVADTVFGDAVYFPDEQYEDGAYVPYIILRHTFNGADKFALSIGEGDRYGKLKKVSLTVKALKIGVVTATVTRV